ncbi:MAG: DUF1624 domain-containing protein [Lachnospiraceae bacterium]|nr:DUF1624 domain-containing protein [Lachnospiraceae bacterium]
MIQTFINTQKEDQKKQHRERNYLIDTLRALTMISMILYHSCYDYFVVFSKDPSWITKPGSFIWQQSICTSFILISGIVWPLGKKNALKRGISLIILGTLITFVTLIFMPDQVIYYGILTFMGIATLLMIPIDKLFSLNFKNGKNKSVPAVILYTLICLFLFIFTKHIPNGYIGTRYHALIYLPKSLYCHDALIPIGFPTPDFYSADYFPLIPWIFIYTLGYILSEPILKNKSITGIGKKKIPFLSQLGTKSLLIYILHQPICFGIVWLICTCFV